MLDPNLRHRLQARRALEPLARTQHDPNLSRLYQARQERLERVRARLLSMASMASLALPIIMTFIGLGTDLTLGQTFYITLAIWISGLIGLNWTIGRLET